MNFRAVASRQWVRLDELLCAISMERTVPISILRISGCSCMCLSRITYYLAVCLDLIII